jgi:hypothetical protein
MTRLRETWLPLLVVRRPSCHMGAGPASTTSGRATTFTSPWSSRTTAIEEHHFADHRYPLLLVPAAVGGPVAVVVWAKVLISRV